VSSKPRLAGVDGLRGGAAVGVVVLHVWMFTGARDPGQPVVLDRVIGELRLGVVYFFVLSGFLLARPWLRAALDGAPSPRLRRYAAMRAARIVPAYWLALAGALLVLAGTGHPRAVSPGDLPVFAVFAQNQFGATAGQLNPPTWSLGIEVGFYALLPVVGWALVRSAARYGRAGVVAVCGTVVAAGLAWTLAGELLGWPATTMTSPPTHLPAFACGLAAAALAHGRRPGRAAATTLLVAGSAAVVLNGVWHSAGTELLGHVVRDLPAAAGLGAIVVGVTARPKGLLDRAPARALGAISYGTYLWHMPVLYWLVTRDVFPRDPLTACLAVLAPTLVLGALSWLAVERPVLRWTARRGDGRRPQPQPFPQSRRDPVPDAAA
jgi:peptidoglycan/LPS O-acetylase OafA/YrhL